MTFILSVAGTARVGVDEVAPNYSSHMVKGTRVVFDDTEGEFSEDEKKRVVCYLDGKIIPGLEGYTSLLRTIKGARTRVTTLIITRGRRGGKMTMPTCAYRDTDSNRAMRFRFSLPGGGAA